MEGNGKDIQYRKTEQTRIASIRRGLKTRVDISDTLALVRQSVPEQYITGSGFCIFHFITDVTEGFDAEVGYPVSEEYEDSDVKTRDLPGMELLYVTHHGPLDTIQDSYQTLYGFTSDHGFISDEFSREIYLDMRDPAASHVELQFIIHNWNRLLEQHLTRVMGEQVKDRVLEKTRDVKLDSTLEERCVWAKTAMKALEQLADDHQSYEIVSSCAHVFPGEQINKLRERYLRTRQIATDPMAAVDAVIDLMESDAAFGERPRREGRVVFSSKRPRDPEAFEQATTTMDRRRAYCFCPLVRGAAGSDMPETFCYCGAGWYRQQWEGAIGKPVRIRISQSILKGDTCCEFAVVLPEDL